MIEAVAWIVGIGMLIVLIAAMANDDGGEL